MNNEIKVENPKSIAVIIVALKMVFSKPLRS